MEKLNLSDLIGETIISLRYSYTICNQDDLQEFHSYLKLKNSYIIEFPVFDNEEFLTLTTENIEFLRNSYEMGIDLTPPKKQLIEGQQIDDIFFCYSEDGLDTEKRPYLKLSNGYYITEINYGPYGQTNVDLIILSENEFLQRVKSLDEKVKSILKPITIKN